MLYAYILFFFLNPKINHRVPAITKMITNSLLLLFQQLSKLNSGYYCIEYDLLLFPLSVSTV